MLAKIIQLKVTCDKADEITLYSAFHKVTYFTINKCGFYYNLNRCQI